MFRRSTRSDLSPPAHFRIRTRDTAEGDEAVLLLLERLCFKTLRSQSVRQLHDRAARLTTRQLPSIHHGGGLTVVCSKNMARARLCDHWLLPTTSEPLGRIAV